MVEVRNGFGVHSVMRFAAIHLFVPLTVYHPHLVIYKFLCYLIFTICSCTTIATNAYDSSAASSVGRDERCVRVCSVGLSQVVCNRYVVGMDDF